MTTSRRKFLYGLLIAPFAELVVRKPKPIGDPVLTIENHKDYVWLQKWTDGKWKIAMDQSGHLFVETQPGEWRKS